MPAAPLHPCKRTVALALALLASLACGPSRADDRDDHDQARSAMERGEVLPLKTVLERLERLRPGTVLEVELERKSSGWVYDIKQLEAGGQVARIRLDARTAQVLGVKNGKPPHRDDPREDPRDDHRNGPRPTTARPAP